jgi:hypothetical protein
LDNSIGIGDLAVLLTAAGVLIYVLGLIGLAIPIHIKHTGDVSAAWYVVSLLPRTVVAGQGLRIWLGLPLRLTFLVLLVALLMRSLSFILPLYYLVILLGLYAGIVVSGARDLEWQRLGFFSRLLLVVAGIIGPPLVGLALLNLTATAPDTTSWLTENRFDTGIMLLFVGNFLLGIPAAVAAKPPLPRVRITKRSEVAPLQLPDPLEGLLVTHSDGFWHLFDENNELLSVPDDKVLVVRMGPEEAASKKAAREEETE